MRRCEDVRMRRCEDVKMFDRPPLLESFAQMLSGIKMKIIIWISKSIEPLFLNPLKKKILPTIGFRSFPLIINQKPY